MTHSQKTPLHRPAPHESCYLHVKGEARYVHDVPPPPGLLHAALVTSPVAHGRIVELDVSAARALPRVHAVLTAADVPGVNDCSAVIADEPLLADGEVHCCGQAIAVVVAESLADCRAAVAAVKLRVEALPAIFSSREAVAAGSYMNGVHIIERGDVQGALARCALRFSGEIETSGQEHFYLETHAALVLPEEGGTYKITSSTQHPSEVQANVAKVLGIPRNRIVVEVLRMGGGFGGKETQGAHLAAWAALAARHTGRPVECWMNRDQDMLFSGKRHPWYSRYEAGFDAHGVLQALDVFTVPNGGWSNDLSRAILDRCLFHIDNAYFIPHVRFEGRIARTNRPSNTAFRGFGAPQGVMIVEEVFNRAAEALGLDPAELRSRSFYRDDEEHNRTPYDFPLPGPRSQRIHEELMESSEYVARREALEAFNQRSPLVKRGIGYQPLKFGVSFTHSMLNQAGALVLIYSDGSVQLNHGGTEMGQGLHTKMMAVCAHELGVPMGRIRAMNTATDKVPNTSATAASAGTDLNGASVHAACVTLLARLRPVAAKVLGVDVARAPDIAFADGQVYIPGESYETSFDAVVRRAYEDQVSLSSTGYYRTPNIKYDASIGRGKPFHYYAYGAAVSEVEVNLLTGEHRVLRTDILHDVGDSLVPSIDRGQIEGAFVQGLGWLSCEELVWNDKGFLLTHSPDSYKIPTIGNMPTDFRVELLQQATQPDVIHGSKAVGEPPFLLAISMVTALRHALASVRPGAAIELKVPCTPEAVLREIERLREAVTVQERQHELTT